MGADDTTRINIESIHQAEIYDLENRFGVIAWFGHHTRHWWALDGDHLVEARTPDRLGEEIMGARWSDAQRQAPDSGACGDGEGQDVTEFFVPRRR
ncbi:hypothetical protein GCM10022254_57200 [Actinomadura meridiana]|uniref:Uncharacterized protein n=1 Tax=Actinomadura meridiana TaxID=559626 RepID=A0ABP8CGH6_9ACTN